MFQFWLEAVVKLLVDRQAELVSPYTGEVLACDGRPLTPRIVAREFCESVLHQQVRWG